MYVSIFAILIAIFLIIIFKKFYIAILAIFVKTKYIIFIYKIIANTFCLILFNIFFFRINYLFFN